MSAPALRAQRWTGKEELRRALPLLHELAAEAALDPLCNRGDWIEAYADAFLEDEDVFGWSVTSPCGEPMALLALRREPARARLALRRATHVADGTFDSEYLDLALRPSHETAALELLLDEITGERGVEALVLSMVPESSRALAALRQTLARRRLPRRERPVAALAAPLADGFEGFVASLRPRMRSKLRQARRRAEDQGLELVWCERESHLDRHLEALFELHARRWRAAGGAGSFADGRRRRFYRDLARRALARGELRFARLEGPDGPLAYQIGLRLGETYYQLQEGFDPEAGDLRVATALRAEAVRRLIEEGVRSYDFMAGDSRHKRDWGGRPRPCTTLAFALPRWRARLAYGLRSLQDGFARRRERRQPVGGGSPEAGAR